MRTDTVREKPVTMQQLRETIKAIKNDGISSTSLDVLRSAKVDVLKDAMPTVEDFKVLTWLWSDNQEIKKAVVLARAVEIFDVKFLRDTLKSYGISPFEVKFAVSTAVNVGLDGLDWAERTVITYNGVRKGLLATAVLEMVNTDNRDRALWLLQHLTDKPKEIIDAVDELAQVGAFRLLMEFEQPLPRYSDLALYVQRKCLDVTDKDLKKAAENGEDGLIEWFHKHCPSLMRDNIYKMVEDAKAEMKRKVEQNGYRG